MLTVLTWFWVQPKGRTAYQPFHVNIWAAMVRRHLKMPHRIACVTDTPEGIDPSIEIIAPPKEFEDVRIASWGEHRPQCHRRLVMFRPDASEFFGERFVCMDLDCIISGDLDPFFDTDADFKMMCGTECNRPYNGSMMLITAGARPQVYHDFTPEGATEAGNRFIGSDQAWIAHRLGPNESKWTLDDGLIWFGRKRTDDTRLMFFPGAEKPWSFAEHSDDPWYGMHYRLEPRGRCLILGYGSTLWKDVDVALDDGPYDGVIASPEAAAHWPGELLAMAMTNEQAGRIAAMHGFSPIWCGVNEEMAA